MVQFNDQWDPTNITVEGNDVPDSWKVCIITGVFQGDNEYNGSLGARISSIFVIFFVSTFLTLFPLIAKRFPNLRVPLYGYLFARYFGTGVIVATAFIHLMDPAYGNIGPNTCVGMTGNWTQYSWAPAIMLVSVFFIFLLDVISQVIVERKFGVQHNHADNEIEDAITRKEVAPGPEFNSSGLENQKAIEKKTGYESELSSLCESEAEISFRKEFGAFLMLEFGVIFHSVTIGLNLGAAGDEFKTLYIVLVFHQSFEGLGLGARLSSIPWPTTRPSWIPYTCCIIYGLVTPISIAIGLGVRTTYMSNSFNANIIQGVLNAISAGILIYNGLVELLARDFIFAKDRTKDLTKLTFNVVVTIIGAGVMALLGKWA